MAFSRIMQELKDEQRDEIMRLTPAERLAMALELSDLCGMLNKSGRIAVKDRHVAGKTEADRLQKMGNDTR